MLNLAPHTLPPPLMGALPRRESALLSRETWSISAIVLWEIGKLAQLGRIAVNLDDPELVRALTRLHTWPLSLDVCRAIRDLDVRGDPADEIIAATSVVHRVQVWSRGISIRWTEL